MFATYPAHRFTAGRLVQVVDVQFVAARTAVASAPLLLATTGLVGQHGRRASASGHRRHLILFQTADRVASRGRS